MGGAIDTILQRVLAALATGLIIDGLGTVVGGENYSGWGLDQLPGWSRNAVVNALDSLPVSRRLAGVVEVIAGVAMIFVIAKLAQQHAEDEQDEDNE